MLLMASGRYVIIGLVALGAESVWSRCRFAELVHYCTIAWLIKQRNIIVLYLNSAMSSFQDVCHLRLDAPLKSTSNV